MREEEFEEGQTVYNKYSGKPYVIRRVSPSGQLAFGNPPYNAGSYTAAWSYMHDRVAAQTHALEQARRALKSGEDRLVESQRQLDAERAHIEWLEQELAKK